MIGLFALFFLKSMAINSLQLYVMKQVALLILCGLLVTAVTQVGAQREATAVVLTLTDQTERYPLGQQIAVLEDLTGRLTLEQIISPAMAGQFSPNTTPILQYGNTRAAIWLRLNLDDQSQTIPYWLLDIPYPSLEHVDLYLPQASGAYTQYPAGLLVPDSQQAYPKSHYSFHIPPGYQPDQSIYLRVASSNALIIPPTLWSPEAFDLKERNENLHWGLYFGILLGMAVFNALLFLSLRDRNYLYLVLYIVAIAAQTAFLSGIAKSALPSQWGNIYHYLYPVIATPNLLFFLLFTTSFLEVKRFSLRLYQTMVGLMVAVLVLFVLIFAADRYLVSTLFLLITLPILVVVILSGLVAWRNSYRPARYFLLAMFVPLIFGLGDSLSRLGILPFYSAVYSIAHAGNVALVMLLSLALADRINHYRRQTEATAEQLRQNESLITQYLNALPMGVAVYGRDAKPRFVNRSALDLLHMNSYDPEEKLDSAAQNFPLYQSGSELPYPADKRPLSQALQGVANHLDDAEMLVNGRRFPIEIDTTPIYDSDGRVEYAISVFRDISQRKTQETAVRVAQELYQSVVEKEALLICRFQHDGVLTFVNQAYCNYFARQREEIVGSNLFATFNEVDGADLQTELRQLTPDHPIHASDKRVYCGGQTRWLRWTSQSFFSENGRLLEYQATGADITEQKEAEEQLARYRENLEELVAERTHQERSRLARDLHDSVTQTLFSANLIAEVLPLQWTQDREGAQTSLHRLRQLTTGALAEMRLLLLELRPSSLVQTPLTTLIRNLCDAFMAKYSIPIAPIFTTNNATLLPAEVKETAYRIAQEALNNIGKHAKASQVTIWLSESEAGLHLRIQDDGKGFDVSQFQPDHLGLEIMQERASEVAAQLLVESAPGAGTTLTFEWKTL